MPIWPSEEWTEAYRDLINASEEYREADTEFLDELPAERVRELAEEGLPVRVPGET